MHFFVIHVHQPENRYFATTEDGRLIPMISLNQPNLSNPALMSWVAQAATEVMTFGFNDYRRRLQESSRFFTRKGWESFTQALQEARIIESIQANTQVITAAPRAAFSFGGNLNRDFLAMWVAYPVAIIKTQLEHNYNETKP